MGHVLLVESWVGAMSTLLPRAIREAGHRFTFLTRNLHHYLRPGGGEGVHPLLAADNVITAETNDLDVLPRDVGQPGDGRLAAGCGVGSVVIVVMQEG
ncbi:hypothetical protein AB0G14_34240, partial [Micromonospora sp. NPDC023814]